MNRPNPDKTTLVIGSGVSQACKFPSGKDLIQRIVELSELPEYLPINKVETTASPSSTEKLKQTYNNLKAHPVLKLFQQIYSFNDTIQQTYNNFDDLILRKNHILNQLQNEPNYRFDSSSSPNVTQGTDPVFVQLS